MNGNDLKNLRLKKGLTQAQLADLSGIPNGTIGRLESTGQDIKKVDMMKKLEEIFKNEIRNENITYNERNNFSRNNSEEKTQNHGLNSPTDINQKATFYKALPQKPQLEAVPVSLHPHNDDDDTGKAKFIYAPDGTMGMRVPIVPAKAQAGYLLGFADPEYFDDFETEIIPVDQEHKGTYLGFEVKGDSGITTDPELMEDNIYPGWRAIGKDLPRQKWKYKLHIHKYDRWIIVHRTEGILIKSIVAHDVDNGMITIHSLNTDYQDKDLYLEDVEQIFNVVQIVPRKKR